MANYKFTEPRCKICKSVNRDYYDSLRLKGWKLEDIAKEWEKREGSKISLRALSNHFRKHTLVPMNEAIKDDIKFKRLIKDRMIESAKIVDEIHNNLTILRNLTNTLVRSIERKSELNTADIQSITSVLSEIRNTISLVLKARESLDVREEFNKDLVIQKIVAVLKDFLDEKTLVLLANRLKGAIDDGTQ